MKYLSKHFYVPIVVILATLIAVGMLSGCKIVQYTTYDPNYTLVHDFSLSGASDYNYGEYPISCIKGASQVNGRGAYCRVIEGYENGGDHRNWKITIARDPKAASPIDPDDPIMVVSGECDLCTQSYTIPRGGECVGKADIDTNFWRFMHGCTIIFADGAMYEGCEYKNWENTWYCDYRATKGVVLQVSNGGGFWWGSYILHKVWDWGRYMGSTIGCAGGIAAFMAGKGLVTYTWLIACVDGPM